MRYKKRWRIGLIVLVIGLLAFGGALTAFGGSPNEMTPIDNITTGNWSTECGQVDCCETDFGGQKIEGWGNDGRDGEFYDDDFDNTIIISNSDEFSFDWSSDTPVACVLVKAGTQYFVKCYDPAETSGSLYIEFQNAISHVTFCFGEDEEELTVSKTVDTYFEREHFWDIDKSVETDKGDEWPEGTPKIWLDGPVGPEIFESATWTVDVAYEGFEDSGYNVSGEITIENTGTVDALITSIEDVLGGTSIDIVCGVAFPYTLAVGETLTCTYSEDGYIEGFNEVTVTTERDTYGATEPIVWNEAPDVEINETVNIEDLSSEFGTEALGSVTAPDGDSFTYSEDFAWLDYQDLCGQGFSITNTATILETEQSSSALLKINIRCEDLDVSKTVETSYTREHFWDIDKSVETEEGHELDDVAKVWLYTDGSGDETATWTVDVTYDGYEDSDFNVSGTITIDNTGQLDAVLTGYQDLLGGVSIDVDWGGWDGTSDFTLAAGATLTGTYSEEFESKIEGKNEVTVTTTKDEYESDADIVWGEPAEEINKTVTIIDDSELFGEEELGTLTAPNDAQFTYTNDFAYEDYYECGSFTYNNTATIIETEQSASAVLKVNVQCYVYDTAYAKGDDAKCFIPYFRNWGWTNPIEPGEYEWDLWAGAGQCDTSKGTLVGSVTVVYDDDGDVTVEYNLFDGYDLKETHVYAGTTMFPQQQRGRRTVDTVAPGQYYNDSPFDGSEVYVIAHAVVGMPDPDFGPDPTE